MYGEGQGNGYEIKNGQLVPCERTLKEGFWDALRRAEIKREAAAGLDTVDTADDFLDSTPGTGKETGVLDGVETVEEFLKRTPGTGTDTALEY